MKSILINISLFFLVIFSISSFPQKNSLVESTLYKKGIAALDKKDDSSAEQFFIKSIKENSDVPSLFELSKIYIKEKTILGRRKGRELLEKAIWKDPKNINIRLVYADLMEYYSKEIAFKKYRDIIEIDSLCASAWYNMGRIKSMEYYDYNNSVNRVDEGYELSLEKYASSLFKDAESYLLNSLKYDSLNSDAYIKLSSLYEDANEPEKGIPLLEKLIRIYPDKTDAHLNLGLLYYKTSKLTESYKEYEAALLLMSISERLDFTYNSVVELLDPVAEELISSLKPKEVRNFIDAFWNASDPLFLTNYNERLLEHYSRVAYSNLRFSLPGKPGWKTDRGEIVLRYGEPLSRTRFRPRINAGGRTAVQVKTDVWQYKDMTFGFEDTYMSSNFVFSDPFPGSRYIPQYNGDTEAFADYVRRVRFETYNPKYEGPSFSIPYNIVQFKDLNKNNNTDVYLNYALNYNDSLVVNNSINYKYDWGLFFHDDYFNPIYKNKGYVAALPISNTVETDSFHYAINSAVMSVKPDSGTLAFEIIRNSDKGVSSNHEIFKTKEFSRDSLDMSDILLAEKVDKDSTKTFPLKRKEINILPNPTSVFSKNINLYIYYEIYNLNVDHNGLADFDQRITIQKIYKENGIQKAINSVLGLAGIGKNNEGVTLSSKYQTQGKNSQMYLQLDMNKSQPGDYIILVTISDNISKKEVSKSAIIKWE
jgi:GWxTD domain-containing protein